MTREQAIRIATNFYTYREGGAPYDLTVKRMEGNRFTMRASSLVTDERVYEIVVDPTYDEITMTEIVAEYKASDFTQQPKMLSELKPGDLFRNEGDCVVYEFWKPTTMFGQPCFLISRKGKDTTDCITDRLVYPCGK